MSNDLGICIPFVSVYTDCNEENQYTGCTLCSCSVNGEWQCELRRQSGDDEEPLDTDAIERTLDAAREELVNYELEEAKRSSSNVMQAEKSDKQFNLDDSPRNIDLEVLKLLRSKRSLVSDDDDISKENRTITFHNVVDEANEDTLKNSNASGTIPVNKVDASHRITIPSNSSTNALHIEHTPSMFNPHAGDNKVDTLVLHDDKEDLMIHHKILEIVGNNSLGEKDKNLSKLLVNEMKIGSETIGDKNASPISNITFTPENDTLTAVTFIAGSLLNKLWNMEKDVNDDSMETDLMKHRTINNLLDLFKEPLNVRQETFLKNALEKISNAMENTDESNISLCDHVEKLKEEAPRSRPMITKLNRTAAAVDAFDKISNALDLIIKYERIDKAISDIKSDSSTRKSYVTPDSEQLSKNENDTLKMFGNILSSLTKILMPHKKGRQFVKGLKRKNVFSDNAKIGDKLKNLKLDHLPISDKDKIVLDYLTHIRNSPKCLLSKNLDENPLIPTIEGNILLNLSEFFKIKSMSDLLKLVDTPKSPIVSSQPTMTTTDVFETEFTTELSTVSEVSTKANKVNQFETTKEKLKSHLKVILQDLIELQNLNGKFLDGKKIEISDALPCIYNLLNANKHKSDVDREPMIQINEDSESINITNPVDKIAEIFDNLKKELKYASLTRRTNVGTESGPRPKSAIVWERTIKHIGKELKTRRSMDVTPPKTFEKLKKTIDNMETSGSNTYKSVAYQTEVPPAERLSLLKTLLVDTFRQINVLKDLKQYIDTDTSIPSLNYKTIDEFVDNANINIKLNEKVANNLGKPKSPLPNQQVRFKKVGSPNVPDSSRPWGNDMKLSRDQIINQLIKNRVMNYIRMKESSLDMDNDLYYDLAKKILLYLEIGNYDVARDLYKVFVTQRNQDSSQHTIDPNIYKSPTNEKFPENRRIPKNIVPLIQFEESTRSKENTPWTNQDQLIKQLLSIKNI